ncbi:ribosomal RNA processing protein 36 homolog [Coccinella septempunctata]|uniref:ribosomal RNA processing protein 36 homolog n=1 Tax=Coccinella septempunctata TaxID=41139 RepID=UPI001D05E5F2|nr:ribosomal RNA processing protein 36 homolog [Coccinella septempunctata]
MDPKNSENESTSEGEHPLDLEVSPEMESEDNKRSKIRKQLSNMSFEDIQKLKEKIGAKVYNQVVLGIKTNKPKTDFKRTNKNRPREMSSKIRVRAQLPSVRTKKNVPRDPRFDSMCGDYDGKEFRENYKFINDMRKNEKKELEKELAITSDPERKTQIKFLIQRIGNQIREAEKTEKLELQKLEESREIREKLQKGEKPIFKRKSEKRVGELLNKYEELKKSNKLQKHIEKRRKKQC